MSTLEMVSEYRATRERYDTAAFELHDQLVRMVFATLTGVLPGTESVEVIGADNEDLIPTPGPDASDQSKVRCSSTSIAATRFVPSKTRWIWSKSSTSTCSSTSQATDTCVPSLSLSARRLQAGRSQPAPLSGLAEPQHRTPAT